METKNNRLSEELKKEARKFAEENLFEPTEHDIMIIHNAMLHGASIALMSWTEQLKNELLDGSKKKIY